VEHELSNRYISKRALELSQVTNKIKEIWRVNEGPFANIFRILSYAIPFIPGLGWTVFALEKLAAFFGWGMGNLGGALDREFGLQPGSEIPSIDQLTGGLDRMFGVVTAANGNEEIIKKAGIISSVLKMVGGTKLIARFLWSVVKWLVLAFGVTKLGDIYTAATGTTKMPGEFLMGDNEGYDQYTGHSLFYLSPLGQTGFKREQLIINDY